MVKSKLVKSKLKILICIKKVWFAKKEKIKRRSKI